MRKHIGTKVYSMLAVLLVIFLGNAYFASRGTLNARNAVQIISSTYMELLTQNEIVTKNVTESRLYGNLIVLTPDEQTAAGISNSVPALLEAIDDAFAVMGDLCAGLNNADLTRALEEYKKQYGRYKLIYNVMQTENEAEDIHITGITFWGTVDHYSWLQNSSNVGGGSSGNLPQCPLLFDEH